MTDISNITRREALLIGGLGGAASLAGVPAYAAQSPAALARAAYIWGFPLVQTQLYLKLARQKGVVFNTLYAARRLATPADKGAVGPNNDTLYATGWLDLASEPVVISVPDTHDRYYSIQLMDAYENSFAYIGRRATGTKEGNYAIVGPGWQGAMPAGVTKIAAPTTAVLALVRTLVTGDADLPAALAVQAGYSVVKLSDFPKVKTSPQLADNPIKLAPATHPAELGAAYFDELSAGLAQFPPPASDQGFVESLAVLGIGPGKTPSKTGNARLLATAALSADRLVRAHAKASAKDVNGWKARYDIVPFITPPLERAAIDVLGAGANIAQEALYFSLANGPDGEVLTGTTPYVLEFPAGQLPPVEAFWSLTLYGADFYLVDNPIHRYEIGDRTPGLVKGADGSLKIAIQHTQPRSGAANWLPAPAGAFQLILRAYQPGPALISGAYELPAITAA